jgi:hypothetical protein
LAPPAGCGMTRAPTFRSYRFASAVKAIVSLARVASV